MLCVFKHSHLLYEVYCDFPLSIQGIAEAQTGHRLKTKPRFEATIQSDVKAQLKKKKNILPVLGLYDCTGAVPSCGEQGLLSGCGSWASLCGGFVWSSGSVVMTPGLSCSVACGEMFPEGSNPCPLHWQAYS